MVALALTALAIVHPGIFFPVLRKQKRGQADPEGRVVEQKDVESSTDESDAPAAAK